MENNDVNQEKEVAKEHIEAQTHHRGSTSHADHMESFLKSNKWLIIALAIIIIAVGVWLRTGLLQYQGLFEPDGFFYYTALKQAVAHGFIVSKSVTLSGWPVPNGLDEAPGVLYMTLVPYFFLRFLGIQLLTVMRYIPIVFAILEAIVAYFLVRYMTNNRLLGLLAVFMVMVSSGNIARTAGAVYRGDTFISLFIMLALLFALLVYTEKNQKRKYIYLGLTALTIGVSCVVWNGGLIVPAVFLVGVTAVAMYAFVAADENALKNSTLLLFMLLIGYILNQLFVQIGLANAGIFASLEFVALILPVCVGVFLASYILGKKNHGPTMKNIIGSTRNRMLFLVAVVALALIASVLLLGSFVHILLTDGNSIYQQNNIANTTQELQPPTWGFIWASFGLQIYLAPIGVILFLLFAHMHGNKSYVRKGKLSLNASYGFIVLFVYLAIAVYLQNGAIRYNAILSIPLALFSAYAVYAILGIAEQYSIEFRSTQIKFSYVFAGFAFALLLIQVTLVQAQSFSSFQADGINPEFLGAMTWMSNHTATNATVLDLWPDGSVVEAWANRTSWQDSVGGENGTRIVEFGSYLFNTSADSQFLIDKAHRPDYVVTRNFWFAELGGIAVEANLTGNLSQYGYDVMTNFNTGGNSTEQIYQFSSASYITQMVVEPLANGSRRIIGLIGPQGQSQLVPLKYIIFFNTTNQNYTVITSNYSQALNFSLMVSFSGANITNAALLGSDLPNTNLFKLLIECGYTQCAYGDNNVSAQLVYANADTKIFKFIYH